MKFPLSAALSLAVLPVAAVPLACERAGDSRGVESKKEARVHQPADVSHAGGAPQVVLPVGAPTTGLPAKEETFTGSLEEIKALIALYHSIHLTPEQERLKVEALSTMKAPCCRDYSLATCCCPCNMAKAAWGLAAHLITEKGYNAEQIRQAEASWLKRINPGGFTGDSCFTGGCSRSMRANGCGGMKEESVVF